MEKWNDSLMVHEVRSVIDGTTQSADVVVTFIRLTKTHLIIVASVLILWQSEV